MLKFLIATYICLFAVDYFLPNVSITGPVVLLITGLVLAIVQVIVKPIISVFLLPFTIITLGIFTGVINIFLLWAVTAIVPGFHIDPMSIADYKLGFFMSLVVVGFVIGWGQRLILVVLNRIW